MAGPETAQGSRRVAEVEFGLHFRKRFFLRTSEERRSIDSGSLSVPLYLSRCVCVSALSLSHTHIHTHTHTPTYVTTDVVLSEFMFEQLASDSLSQMRPSRTEKLMRKLGGLLTRVRCADRPLTLYPFPSSSLLFLLTRTPTHTQN